MKFLIVVDMQVDFITGALGSELAVAIVPNVVKKIKNFDGKVIFTRDTHFENYPESLEGKNLPVPHCVKGTHGWQIRKELDGLRKTEAVDKISFGSPELARTLAEKKDVESITLVGLCTDTSVSHSEIVDFMVKKSKREKIYSFYVSLCNDLEDRGY